MEILVKAGQFVLSISLLIILHELGHFIPARLFKTRVEKFYLFFDAYFALFKKKIGETEYGIGWLPLGGYVKIAGMVDESMDTESLKQPPQPWEFRSKPAWQRLIIMVGGVTVNVLLAFAIYAGMLMVWGEEYLPTQAVKYGVNPSAEAKAIGFRTGDRIVNVNGVEVENFAQVPVEILLSASGFVTVERDGIEEQISFDATHVRDLIQSQSNFLEPRFPYVIEKFSDSSSAKAAGLLPGDSLVSLNGHAMFCFDAFYDSIPQYAGKTVTLGLYRSGSSMELPVSIDKNGRLGAYAAPAGRFFQTETREYGFFEAIPAGIAKSGRMLGDYVRQFKLILNPKTEAYKEVGGFIMMAQQFDGVWNWRRFWAFTAFLSLMLAFLNILPIPALDGGHVVFTLWEMITGKPAPQKVLEWAQMAGVIILLSLILLANGNDVLRLFR
ncbi:RIP metalloprotease RseP [bacterium]|nr:RIP metalloprotease RseP [bacterium]